MKCNSFLCFSLLFIVVFFNTFPTHAQGLSKTYLDSVQKLKYSVIFDLIVKSEKDIKQTLAREYLKKSRKEDNTDKTIFAYRMLYSIEINDYAKAISYIDSAITLSKFSRNENYPSVLYLERGNIEESVGNFHKALNNYIIATKYAKESVNENLEYYAKHNIGVQRRNIGDYSEAKRMFKECLDYEFKKGVKVEGDSISVALTQNELINTYISAREIDSSIMLNKRSLLKVRNLNLDYLFHLNKGIGEFYNSNIDSSIFELELANRKLLEIPFHDYDITYYLLFSELYLGKAFFKKNQISESEKHFNYIDSMSRSESYYHPIVKDALLNLIDICRIKEDKENELNYINQLLMTDSIIDNQNRLVHNKLIKNYDIPELLESREILISELKNKNSLSINFIFFLGLILLSIIVFFVWLAKRKNKFYKLKYQELINKYDKGVKTKDETISTDAKNDSEVIEISKEIVERVLNELEYFEKNKGFLEKSISVTLLASSFNTNSKYLSKIINHSKKRTFTTYINELRINHFIEMIKTNPTARKYTISALASENGFSSTEVFSKTFKKMTGLYPSYFIKQQTNE